MWICICRLKFQLQWMLCSGEQLWILQIWKSGSNETSRGHFSFVSRRVPCLEFVHSEGHARLVYPLLLGQSQRLALRP